jgi:NADH-quinone oxidoreductase E subunit
MSFGAPAPETQQPKSFVFSTENRERAERIIGKYPPGRQQSAVIPLLDLAQRQHENWLPRAAMDHVAELLEMPPIKVYEVASFYTMFNKAPVGRHFFQVCTTTPCWLVGSDEVLRAIRDKTGCRPGHASADGQVSVVEVECLGACVNAPMVQVNDDFYEDLDYDRTCALIDALRAGREVEAGSQIGRHGSEAQKGPTTMLGRRPKAAAAAEAAHPGEPTAAPQPEPVPATGEGPAPEDVAAQAEAHPEAHSGDVAPQKKGRPKTKAQPPGKVTPADEKGS